MITEHQKNLRKKNLGSSDLSVIFGVHPFERPTVYDIWGRLTGQVEDDVPPTPAMKLGSALESTVINLFREDHPVTLKNLRRKHAFLNLAVNVDAITIEGSNPVEAKTCDHFSPTRIDWGPTDENVPDHVALQATAHMMVMDREVCYVPSLVSGVYRLYRVNRNAELVKQIQQKLHAWWEEHIYKGNPPEGLPSRAVGLRWKREPGKVISLPSAYDNVSSILCDKQAATNIAKDKKLAEQEILKAMGDAEEAIVEGFRVTVRWQERRSLNTKKLTEDHPEIAKEYASVTRFPVMRIIENKEIEDASTGRNDAKDEPQKQGSDADRERDGAQGAIGQPSGSPAAEDGTRGGREGVPPELDGTGDEQPGHPAVQPAISP